MPHDPWLDRWISELHQRASGAPILEIGCGSGQDTEVLARRGLKVFAFDLSAEEVAKAKLKAPEANISVQDVRQTFPLEGTGVPVVVASLSLHYFPWLQTQRLIERIRNTLSPGGLLLARLNSTEDSNFGAAGHPEVEPGLYLVNGQLKRFFSQGDITALFKGGWRVLTMEHKVSLKYRVPKHLWEVAVESAA